MSKAEFGDSGPVDAADARLKDVLRSEARAAIARLPNDERRQFDALIAAAILASPGYQSALQVLCYAALGDEVDLAGVMDAALASGKRVFLPVTDVRGWTISFHRWRGTRDLVRGAAGVDEPQQDAGPESLPSLVLVPGRLFTPHGARIGRGRGCYDGVLADLGKLGPVVGVGYGCQVRAELPQRVGDIRVDCVVTERGVIDPEGADVTSSS